MKNLNSAFKKLFILIFYINLNAASKCVNKRPHIIFIMADDLGWNDVGFHGNDVISTPNIDALAYSGVILNNYYVQPVCTPSRGAFLTGLYPIHIGLQHRVIRSGEPFGLPLNFKIFPQYLKRLGYSTRIVGKWHLGHFRKEYTPTFRGFDSHYGYWTASIDYFNYTNGLAPQFETGHDFRRDMKVEYPPIGTYVTDLFTEESAKIINEHSSCKPLFLLISHLAPHVGNPGSRLQAPSKDIRRFSYIKDENRRIYAAMLWKLDESVGRVTKALADNGMLRNSIIVFSADNGGGSGGLEGSASSNWPLRGTKATLWEAGIRGASFIWSPLIKNPGRVSNEMIHITDWLPTLYHAVGGLASDLPKMDGKNVWKTIQGRSTSPRSEILLNIDPVVNGAAIRVGDWKLLYNPFDPEILEPRFNGWFGPSERGSSRNESRKQFQEVIKSFSGRAVQKLMPRIFNKIFSVSKDAEILCDEIPEDATATCNDPLNPCLFNIASDPCEYYDVSSSYPSIVKLLQNKLCSYNCTAVPPENKPPDPRGNPIFWNNTWTNWIDHIEGN